MYTLLLARTVSSAHSCFFPSLRFLTLAPVVGSESSFGSQLPYQTGSGRLSINDPPPAHAHTGPSRPFSSTSDERLRHLTDMTAPATWYPMARMMKRRIIAHMGPTNSGKTHAALEALKAASTGVYCGPLRLLACEVADRLNGQGLACNLVTGQDVRDVAGARHTACTVEMVKVDQRVSVAVIDEVQVLGHPTRGWGWTRALLGLPAADVHVCGDPAALPLLEALVQLCGDTLEVREYERLSPLLLEPEPVDVPKEVKGGDCVVAFSRRRIHALRKEIEIRSTFRCSMVYGALPPEARHVQASLFNKQHGGAARVHPRVLVATDAVGMGLNLAIRRVVFTTVHKFNGEQLQPLSVAEVKQIAGRAGRYCSGQGEGRVAGVEQEDVEYLRSCLNSPSEPVLQACLFPRFDQLAAYSEEVAGGDLLRGLERLAAEARLAPQFFFAGCDNMLLLGQLLERVPLEQEELYTFLISPADAEDPPVAEAFVKFASQYAESGRLYSDSIVTHPLWVPRNERQLEKLEGIWRVYDLFLWLGRRLGQGSVRGLRHAQQARDECGALIEEALREGRYHLTHRKERIRRKRKRRVGIQDEEEEGDEGGAISEGELDGEREVDHEDRAPAGLVWDYAEEAPLTTKLIAH